MRKLLTRYLPAFAAALCLLAAGTMPLAAEEGYTEDGQAVYDGAETADPGYVDPGYADPGTDGTGYDPSQDGTGMPEDAGTEYTDGTDLSGETPSDGQTEEGEEQDGGGEGTQPVFGDYETIEIYGSETDDEKAICRTRVIFTGDSRTVGMHHAVESEDFWFAKVGQGYAWMTETALDQVEESLRPNTDVVVLFGVNDLRNCTEYITCLNEKAKEWKTKGVRTYFVSVNPVRDGYAGEVTNSAISEFNARVKAEFTEGAYIDTYNAIIDTYVAPDGLHYDDATYQAIYSYIMDNIARADYSAVFDFDYYYGAYEDVAAEYAGDPNGAFLHFMGVGMQEGRQASEEFDMRSYQNEYADLRRGQSFLLSALCNEGKSGRTPRDRLRYHAGYPDGL